MAQDAKSNKKKEVLVNPIAKDLRSPLYKPRVVKTKTKYNRKPRMPSGAFDFVKDTKIKPIFPVV